MKHNFECYCRSAVISFSIRFNKVWNMPWMGPRALNMLRRFAMSVLFMARVSTAAIMYTGTKKTTPISSRITLLKPRWETSRYVSPPAMAEDKIILADDDQFTVTPYFFPAQ